MSFFTGYSLMMTFSQSLLLLITLIGYNQLYLRTGNDLKLWFDVYFKYAFFIAWIGIVDFLYFLIVGQSLFVLTLDLHESVSDIPRLKSIMLEPGYVVTFLAPAVTCIFIKKGYFKCNKLKSSTIVLAFCLTLSTSMLMTFFIILLVKFYLFLKKYFLVFVVIAISLSGILLLNLKNKDIEGEDNTTAINKVVESLSIVGDATPYDFEMLNASSYSQLTNMWIAFHAPYRLIGTGLGTHSQNYESLYKSDFSLYGLNKHDAYSIFSRILSEFGYIGILLYLLFLYKCYNKNNLYSTCFLVSIIGTFVRGGNYTIYCIALFHFLYYHCRKVDIS